MNLPNKLTLGRLLIIPFFVFFIAYDIFSDQETSRYVAALLFIGASVTDYLDGNIARKRGLVTDFGKFMDPLADKFLILGAMFAICYSGYMFDYGAISFDSYFSAEIIRQIFFWTAIVVVFRELAVTSMRLVVAKTSGEVISASMLGKIKTCSQIVGTSAVILEPVLFPFLRGWLTVISICVMLIFTVISGINYLSTYWKYINTNK